MKIPKIVEDQFWEEHRGRNVKRPFRKELYEWLKTAYHVEGMSIVEIADVFSSHRIRVDRLLGWYELRVGEAERIRRGAFGKLSGSAKSKLNDKRWMLEKWKKGWAVQTIAEDLSCGRTTVYRYLKKYGAKMRPSLKKTPQQRKLVAALKESGFKLSKRCLEYQVSGPKGWPLAIDVALLKSKIAIEVDGSVHLGREDQDSMRDAYLESLGWTVIHFWNGEVDRDVKGVVKKVRALRRKVQERRAVTTSK